MIDLDLFSDILKDVQMATNFVKKWQTPHIRRSCIQKRNAISCEIFVKFGTVTPVLTELINCERQVRHCQ